VIADIQGGAAQVSEHEDPKRDQSEPDQPYTAPACWAGLLEHPTTMKITIYGWRARVYSCCSRRHQRRYWQTWGTKSDSVEIRSGSGFGSSQIHQEGIIISLHT